MHSNKTVWEHVIILLVHQYCDRTFVNKYMVKNSKISQLGTNKNKNNHSNKNIQLVIRTVQQYYAHVWLCEQLFSLNFHTHEYFFLCTIIP